MKKLMIVWIAMMFVKTTTAQNLNTDYKLSIKIYNLARYEETEKIIPQGTGAPNPLFFKKQTLNLLHPTFAVQWRSKKRNFHEIEIMDLKWENTYSTAELRNDSSKTNSQLYNDRVRETSIAARYEFTFVFNKKKERKLVPSLGFGISPYYICYNLNSELSSSLPAVEKHVGIRTFVTPRVTYYIKQKLFVDLNIPICFSQLEYFTETSNDSSIPIAERKTFSFDANEFPKLFSARIGVGVKI